MQQPSQEHPEGTVVAELSQRLHDPRPGAAAEQGRRLGKARCGLIQEHAGPCPLLGFMPIAIRARAKKESQSMPTYDYICDACGHEFETYEPITATPRTDCPECKVLKLRRKIGPGAAILFKGSGFYQTDYRSESYKKAAKADKSSSEPAKPAGDSKSARVDESVQERAGKDGPCAQRVT